MNSGDIKLKHKVDLKPLTTIKIGGRAEYFFEALNIRALRRIIDEYCFSFYILGKGSNLLIEDGVIKKPVVKLGKGFSYIRKSGNYLEAGALTPLSFLIKYCVKNNLSGLENLIGIPATVGGLLRMNASSFGSSVCRCVESVDVLDGQGNAKTLEKGQIEFGYRFSSLRDYFILSVKFSLSKEKDLKEKARGLLARRFASQDFNFPGCGCFFKNPPEGAAGFLIESCGLKGLRKGGAQVSSKHANFIINVGSARYKDADYLIRKVKDKVSEKYNILLEEEVIRWT